MARAFAFVVLALALGGAYGAAAPSTRAPTEFVIDHYRLVSREPIDRLFVRLTFSADLTNARATPIAGATARLVYFPPAFILDDQLSFGPALAGARVTSADTFSLRWPARAPIHHKLHLLRWQVTTANNAAPVANAGPDQSVRVGESVQLDGHTSSDVDGDVLHYRWTLTKRPSGSQAQLLTSNMSTSSFVADRAGAYEASLIVNDGSLDSTPDTVSINTTNSAPIARAGADQSVFVGDAVLLDGSASSDVDGDVLTFQWELLSRPAGSQATLANSTNVQASLIADAPGEYDVQLTVNDGQSSSAPDSIRISTQNSKPVANAGPDQSLRVHDVALLDGSTSFDVDNDALTYRWSLIDMPPLSATVLQDGASTTPSFLIDRAGSYTVQLIVNDGLADSDADQVIVSTENTKPVADAGPDQGAHVGDTVVLDGNASSDADGDNLSFAWSLIAKPSDSQAQLSGADSATPSFVPDSPGLFSAQLIVSDGKSASDPDLSLVTVLAQENAPPVITSSPVTTASVGVLYTYDLEATDSDANDVLHYALATAPTGMTIDSATGVIQWTPESVQTVNVVATVSDGHNPLVEQAFQIQARAANAQVPDLVSLPQSYAETALARSGLALGEVTQARSDDVGVGNVISQLPAANTLVRRGAAVSLVVSAGAASAQAPVPLSTVTVDGAIDQEVTEVPGFDGEPPRPVAVLTDRSGIPMHFVANELIVLSNDVAAVNALALRLGGSIARTIDPASVGLGGGQQHLLRLPASQLTGAVDVPRLAVDLHSIDPNSRSDIRVKSSATLNLLAIAARERARGVSIALNVVTQGATFVTRTTTENPSLPVCAVIPPATQPVEAPNCAIGLLNNSESFNSNAYAWSYMEGATQNIHVGEAWRLMSLAGSLANKVKIAVLDGGFGQNSVDNPPDTTLNNNSLFVSGFPKNSLKCTNGVTCDWHGTNVTSAAMGVPDDAQGAAGPAGPVARALQIRYSGDVFNFISGYTIAFTSGSRILNVSNVERVPAAFSFVVLPFDVATRAARAAGLLIFAAAGNKGDNVDFEDCFIECWEEAWWTPCENGGVTCVGALRDGDLFRRSTSNYGDSQVEIFGPGNVWVGGDPADAEPHAVGGTSVAAPFVAGVAALIIAAKPGANADEVEQILLSTANASPDATVSRAVNAQAAATQALGGTPVCEPPAITSPSAQLKLVACRPITISAHHQAAFGPYQYRWRKTIGGVTSDLVDADNISGSRSADLNFNPLRPADTLPLYDVVVSNICGTSTSVRFGISTFEGAVEQVSPLPGRRTAHAMAFDSQRGKMVIFGGFKLVPSGVTFGLELRGDTLERSSGSWQVVSNQGPSRRRLPGMAYDERRGVTVLFGGNICAQSQFCVNGDPSGGAVFGDTWEWDGQTWTQRAPTSSPAPRSAHTMTYDPVRQRVVLFGGVTAQGVAGAADMWEWDGNEWTRRGTDPDPTFGLPRTTGSDTLAYDRARNVYVLHRVFDTWELNGIGRWTRKADAIPGVVVGYPSTIAYDSTRQRTLLYAVLSSAQGVSNALFEWTDSAWHRTDAVLPTREFPTLAYDSVRNRTVLAGGTVSGVPLSVEQISEDAFEWRYFADDPTCALGPP